MAKYDYASRGVTIEPDEIFISDGAKSDCGNIGDLFSTDNKVAVCDPVYTVYVDTNAMSGRAGDYDTEKRLLEQHLLHAHRGGERLCPPPCPRKRWT